MFAHICASLPTEHLHIGALHVPLCVDIPTEATSPPKAYVRLNIWFTILLGGSEKQDAEEPADQFHTGTDLFAPSPLEGRHEGIQFLFEVNLGELREEVEGSGRRRRRDRREAPSAVSKMDSRSCNWLKKAFN